MSLFIKYGTVQAQKTANLLNVAYSYESQGRNIICMKPEIDTRDGSFIKSRTGQKRKCYLVKEEDSISEILVNHADRENIEWISAVFIDECQFLSNKHVEEIISISHEFDIPFLLYGLYSDYKGEHFESMSKLMVYAKDIEKISNVLCGICDKKATMNMRLINGIPTFDGDSISVDEDMSKSEYIPVCSSCFTKHKFNYK